MTKVLDRIPPQSIEMENAILGIMMQYSHAIDAVTGILTTESFYSTGNQIVFDTITRLHAKGRTPDLTAVVEQLTSDGKIEKAGGAYGVSKLSNSVTSSVDIEGKCKKVQEKFILRELINFSGDIQNNCFEFGADAFDLLDFAEGKILDMSVSHLNSDYTDLKTGMVRMITIMEEMRAKGEVITGVPSGYPELDKITHGWQPTDFIVIAARPSVGKSAFGLNIARQAATHKTKKTSVGYFSLEMSLNQLVQRIISAQSGIWLNKIKTGNLEPYQMDMLMKNGVIPLEGANVFIDDTAGLTIAQLRSKARRMVMKDNVGMIIIDYLQLIEGTKDKNKSGNREQEISGISRELKKLAKQLKIPVIALAQLSREVEKRAVKTPVLSDLRESGAIEQDADVVAFIYRPSLEERKQDAELSKVGSFDIAKHRNGELINLVFEVEDSIQKWSEVGVLGKEPVNNFRPVSIDRTEAKSANSEARLYVQPGLKMNNPDDPPF